MVLTGLFRSYVLAVVVRPICLSVRFAESRLASIRILVRSKRVIVSARETSKEKTTGLVFEET